MMDYCLRDSSIERSIDLVSAVLSRKLDPSRMNMRLGGNRKPVFRELRLPRLAFQVELNGRAIPRTGVSNFSLRNQVPGIKL